MDKSAPPGSGPGRGRAGSGSWQPLPQPSVLKAEKRPGRVCPKKLTVQTKKVRAAGLGAAVSPPPNSSPQKSREDRLRAELGKIIGKNPSWDVSAAPVVSPVSWRDEIPQDSWDPRPWGQNERRGIRLLPESFDESAGAVEAASPVMVYGSSALDLLPSPIISSSGVDSRLRPCLSFRVQSAGTPSQGAELPAYAPWSRQTRGIQPEQDTILEPELSALPAPGRASSHPDGLNGNLDEEDRGPGDEIVSLFNFPVREDIGGWPAESFRDSISSAGEGAPPLPQASAESLEALAKPDAALSHSRHARFAFSRRVSKRPFSPALSLNLALSECSEDEGHAPRSLPWDSSEALLSPTDSVEKAAPPFFDQMAGEQACPSALDSPLISEAPCSLIGHTPPGPSAMSDDDLIAGLRRTQQYQSILDVEGLIRPSITVTDNGESVSVSFLARPNGLFSQQDVSIDTICSSGSSDAVGSPANLE